jgi:hypothetical protein
MRPTRGLTEHLFSRGPVCFPGGGDPWGFGLDPSGEHAKRTRPTGFFFCHFGIEK